MFFGSNLALGLDIGTTSIKMVELKKSGKSYKINNFGMAYLPEGVIEGGAIQDPTVLGDCIAQLHKDRKFKSKKVAVGVFGGAVVAKKIAMPRYEDSLIREQIKWEAEQYIPFDLSEVSLDFHKLKSTSEGETMEVLLVAAKQDYILRYFEAVALSGLDCDVIDVSGFALANCFEANYGQKRETVALINIGSGVSNLVIVDRGEVVFNRDIPIGGNLYNSEISRELGVTPSEAEELKVGVSFAQESPPELLAIIGQTNELICEEIKSSFDFYSSANSGPEVSEVFLSGGTANISQLVEAVTQTTGLSCQKFNPLQSFSAKPKVLSEVELDGLRPLLPVVLGLGMRRKGDS